MADKKDKQGKKGKNAPDVIRIEAGDETTEKKHVSAADKPLQSDKYLNDDFIKTVTGENNAALKAAEAQLKLYDDIIRKVTGESNTVLKAIQETWENNNIAINRLQTDIAERTAAIAEAWKNGATQKAIEELTPALKQIQAYFNSEAYQIIYKYNTVALKKNTEIKENAAPGEDVELLPDSDFIGVVLSEYQERGELQEDISVAQIIKESYTETGERTDSNTYTELLKRAAELYTEYDKDPAAFEEKFEAEQQERAKAEAITYKTGTTITTATHKLPNQFFSPICSPAKRELINGQMEFIPLRYEKDGAKKEITLRYSYSYNSELLKKCGIKEENFDDFDYFVTACLDNLFLEGNTKVTLTKIWHEMGNTGKPNKTQLKDLSDSIIKGQSTIMTIDASEVYEAWGKSSKSLDPSSPCMPVKRTPDTVDIQGKRTEGFIYILSTSPFYDIGEATGQIATWSKNILKNYTGRKTRRFWSILRYITREIHRIQYAPQKNKITYQSLYNYVGAKTQSAKNNTKKMLYKILDECFVTEKYITKYKEDIQLSEGVLLTVKKKNNQKP